jgi:5-methylcytosine-specific restriction endonuclease McrA
MDERSTSDHGTRACYERGCRCDACRAATADYCRNWRADHPEKGAEANRKWRATHPEEAAETARKWLVAHLDKHAAKERNRRARKRGNGGSHTADDVQAQYDHQCGKCFWCGKRLGKSYHVDHVVPLALGGSNGPENIVVACAHCNKSKGAKHPMDFAGVMF